MSPPTPAGAPRAPTPPGARAALVAVGGLVASGKSTLARALAEALGAERLEADRVRAALAVRDERELPHEAAWERQFRSGFTEEVYAALLEEARRALERGRPVVVEGCFARLAQRAFAASLASQLGRPFVFVETRVPRAVLDGRLRERARAQGVATAEWEALRDALAARWEPAEELAADERLVVDGDAPPAESVERVARRLAEIAPRARGAGPPAGGGATPAERRRPR